MKSNYIIIALSFLTLSLLSQDILSLEDSFKKALEKNHNILISKNQKVIAENMATAGNAGMLPKVDLSGGGNLANSKADLEFAGGTPPLVDVSSESLGTNANVGLTYNLFDGMGSFKTFQKLKNQSNIAGIQSNLTIESTLMQVANLYFQGCNLQSQLAIANESISISKEKLDRLKSKNEYGSVSKISVLNAEVDLNSDSTNYLSSTISLSKIKRSLNLLLGESDQVDYVFDETLTFDLALNLDELKKGSEENNVNLLLVQSNLMNVQLDQKIKQSYIMPRLIMGVNYGYNHSESNASLILSQSTLGVTGTLTLSWNLFDGGKKATALKNAQVAIENNELLVDQSKKKISSEFIQERENYKNSLAIYQLQSRSLKTAELNYLRSKELFNQGQITSLQYREAQINLNRVKSQLANAKYTAKLSEIELKRMAGGLISF